MVMADFASYREAQNDLRGLYADRGVWNRMSAMMNIANSGIFSADRAVNDYAAQHLARKAHQINRNCGVFCGRERPPNKTAWEQSECP